MESISNSKEWALRGSWIALAGGLTFFDVWITRNVEFGLFNGIGCHHVAASGLAASGVIAATSAYRSPQRFIPLTFATDTYAALCLGYFGAKSMDALKDGFGYAQSLVWSQSARALNDLCWEEMWGAGMASAALGTGGGAIAFSGALRRGEPWAVQWEQRSHDLWASLFGLSGEEGKGVRASVRAFYEQVRDSFPLFSAQYRDSPQVATPGREPKTDWEKCFAQLDSLAAKACYYGVWGTFHLAGLRASPFCFTLGVVAKSIGSRYVEEWRSKFFSFFDGGAEAFVRRSYRDRFFYLGCLGLSGVFMNCWMWAGAQLFGIRCFCIQIDYLLPFALGALATDTAIKAWRDTKTIA